MAKKIFKISGMHCVACSLNIEGALEDIGVTARVNYAKQLVECEYDADVVGETKIKNAIESEGYGCTTG